MAGRGLRVITAVERPGSTRTALPWARPFGGPWCRRGRRGDKRAPDEVGSNDRIRHRPTPDRTSPMATKRSSGLSTSGDRVAAKAIVGSTSAGRGLWRRRNRVERSSSPRAGRALTRAESTDCIRSIGPPTPPPGGVEITCIASPRGPRCHDTRTRSAPSVVPHVPGRGSGHHSGNA